MAVEAKYMFFYATMQVCSRAPIMQKIDVLGCEHILAKLWEHGSHKMLAQSAKEIMLNWKSRGSPGQMVYLVSQCRTLQMFPLKLQDVWRHGCSHSKGQLLRRRLSYKVIKGSLKSGWYCSPCPSMLFSAYKFIWSAVCTGTVVFYTTVWNALCHT